MATYKSTHTGAEIDAGIDKATTAESNWSLLMDNLGIGRWANQHIYAFYWDTDITFYDTLAPYYSNCSRYLQGIECRGRDFNELMPNATITLNDNFGKIDGSYMFYGMVNPVGLKLSSIDFSNAEMWFTFSNCPTLQKVEVKDGCTVYCSPYVAFIFYNCPKLTTVGTLNMSKVDKLISVFGYCPLLKTIKWTNVHCSFDISPSTAFEEADLVEIISNLDPVTTAQTLTMGATNLAKLTDEEKQVATDKGWVLA